MALTRITEQPQRGVYTQEVLDFLVTGWAKASTDLPKRHGKRSKFVLVGLKSAIHHLAVDHFVCVKFDRVTDEITLERY